MTGTRIQTADDCRAAARALHTTTGANVTGRTWHVGL
jgi:hypothetical protein